MANTYKQRIFKAKTKQELQQISYEAFLNETSTIYNKVLDWCIEREKEWENGTK